MVEVEFESVFDRKIREDEDTLSTVIERSSHTTTGAFDIVPNKPANVRNSNFSLGNNHNHHHPISNATGQGNNNTDDDASKASLRVHRSNRCWDRRKIWNKFFSSLLFFVAVGVCGFVIILLTGVIRPGREELDSNTSKENTASSTKKILSTFLASLPNFTLEALQNPNSSQSFAFRWLERDPNLENLLGEEILQRFVLSTIYFSTNGAEWDNNDNWLNYDVGECDWYGVEDCIFLAEQLKLSLNGLNGKLPSEISLLTNLVDIDLSGNELSGALPFELGSLSKLNVLQLSDNLLNGTLPNELGNIQRMTKLVLKNNFISGTLPTTLGKLTYIGELNLSKNRFYGSIPSELGKICRFLETWGGRSVTVELHDNQLSGTIPTEIGQTRYIRNLKLNGNNLTGTIPTELGLLGNLNYIHLFNNSLHGSIPNEICYLKQRRLHGLNDIIIDCKLVLCNCNCNCAD